MNILQIDNLKTYFYAQSGIVKAVNDVSFKIKDNTVFGLVGESGSGKTLTALSILRLVPEPGKIMGGAILFDGTDLLAMDEEYLRSVRGSKITMVFQEPSSAFNPVFTIGYQITEAILAHQKIGEQKAKESAMEYLKKARIPDPKKVFYDYPHRLSGGTKQRAMIAMALVNTPRLLILDEPTTALDVTIQAEILDLLKEIIELEKLSILFISHDFGIIAKMCDEVGVMHRGRIVEMGSTHNIITNPKEKYTISLLESVRALA
ncbi:MAG: ABC transporter ATP-binding protein [Candidatus Omnitrophota bacterium]